MPEGKYLASRLVGKAIEPITWRVHMPPAPPLSWEYSNGYMGECEPECPTRLPTLGDFATAVVGDCGRVIIVRMPGSR